MVFNTLDFHVSTQHGEEPVALHRSFRLKINYVVDSFSLRIPKKIKTSLFHKLNVCVRDAQSQNVPFYVLEGIGMVEIVDPGIASIYEATQAAGARRVKAFLKSGIQTAANNDQLFADHLDVWERLLATVDEEFDYDCRISRSHSSRRWRGDVALVISPTAYHYDVLIKDSKSLKTIRRHRIKTTECALPFYQGIGTAKLRWEGADIVGYTKDDQEAFRFHNTIGSGTK